MPRVARRERPADGDLGHAERREHAAGAEPERLGRGDERLDGVRVDRLGAAERERQRRQVEALASAAAPGWPAPTRSSARRWRCRRQSQIHCIQLPGWARKSCGAACTSSHAAASSGATGSRRGPCRGRAAATTTITSSRLELGRLAAWRRGWRASTRSGIITPLGSLVEPLVYCRMTSRSGSCGGISQPLAARHCRRAGQHGRHRLDRRVAGRRRRRTPASRSSISTSLASPWRMRGAGATRRTRRATPSASAAAAPSTGDAGQPAALDDRDQRRGWWARGWRRGRRAPGRGPAGRRRPPGRRRGSAPTARTRRRRPARPTSPTNRTPVGSVGGLIEAVDDRVGAVVATWRWRRR